MGLVTWIPSLWSIFCTLSGITVFVSLASYTLPALYLAFVARPQDLRKKYGHWAVVTGASSGIGKALTKKLATQGVNVIMIALDNDMLRDTHAKLQAEFSAVELRAVGVDLGRYGDGDLDYMRAIREMTDDVPVSIVFNNAGYLLMGFFERRDADAHVVNLECNSICGVRIIHHFYSRMVAEHIKGCIAITSSAACYLPAPFATIYGSSKAFLSHFGASLAIEAEQNGIDITVIHPSYTHSNFYANAPKLDVVAFLEKFGWTSDAVADAIFASVGRTIVRDIGAYASITNLLGRCVDSGFLASAIIPFRDSMAPPASS